MWKILSNNCHPLKLFWRVSFNKRLFWVHLLAIKLYFLVLIFHHCYFVMLVGTFVLQYCLFLVCKHFIVSHPKWTKESYYVCVLKTIIDCCMYVTLMKLFYCILHTIWLGNCIMWNSVINQAPKHHITPVTAHVLGEFAHSKYFSRYRTTWRCLVCRINHIYVVTDLV